MPMPPSGVFSPRRGAISILMLFTMFTLVVLVGLLYNAAEYAVRKRKVQAAADAAAQATALWTARTTNIVAGTNQLIVENASAETIWRAVNSTISGISQRLTREPTAIQRTLDQIDRQRIRNDNNRNGPDEVLALKLNLKEAVLTEMLLMYPNQWAIYQQFVARSAPGLAALTPAELLQRRSLIYGYQSEVMDLTPAAIEEQRAAVADFYKCDVTLAAPTEAEINAPVKSIDHVNVEGVGVNGTSVWDGETNRNIWIVGGYWGEIPCPPLARFFWDRVWNDFGENRADSLVPIPRALDNERTRIEGLVRAMLIPPQDTLPKFFPAYADALREILDMHLTERFAVNLFRDNVSRSGASVLWGLGDAPQHVLITYDRYHVPEWAQPSVYQDAYNYVYNDVYNRNYEQLRQRRHRELTRPTRPPAPPPTPDPQAWNEANAWARPLAQQGATIIAQEAASIWISRTWPYEITPPEQPVPPTAGISTDDRHRYFTLLAAAETTDATAPRPILKNYLTPITTPSAAFAQAEAFNWMEYNGGYGASDSYTNRMPPRPWRVSTAGGWNWRPRLAFSDALFDAATNHADFAAMLESSGITIRDEQAIDELTNH